MKLEQASNDQAEAILTLVNLAYRGDSGWTRETDIVAGARATRAEIDRAIDDPACHLLVYSSEDEVLACICIEQQKEKAYIGLLAVHPRLQGMGRGAAVLAAAEHYAAARLGSRKYVMAVVSQRPELIAWYERRAYRRTGTIAPYPLHLATGTPTISDLSITWLEKDV